MSRLYAGPGEYWAGNDMTIRLTAVRRADEQSASLLIESGLLILGTCLAALVIIAIALL